METDAASLRLVELRIADDPTSWRDAGFAVDDDLVALGAVQVRLVGRSGDDTPSGVVGWTLVGVTVADGDLDGLPTEVAVPTATDDADPAPTHPNGCTGLDHVVVLTPDLDRTLAALDAAGLDLRRIRDTTSYGSPMRQAFFRLGPVILEVVSGDTGTGVPAVDAPATWFGLAIDVADLDETAATLGDGLGSIKDAVQDGRRIATLRHRDLGLSVAIAAMDDHAGR
ncbi:MAG: hypothetical protein KDA97_08525 [Acidimicrobiales bacterium]|nr:hypothetical protein [Acidimicrobiales bacterium]